MTVNFIILAILERWLHIQKFADFGNFWSSAMDGNPLVAKPMLYNTHKTHIPCIHRSDLAMFEDLRRNEYSLAHSKEFVVRCFK